MNQISVKLFDVKSFNLTYNFSTEVNSTSPNKGALINFHETLNWKVKPLDGLSHQADKYKFCIHVSIESCIHVSIEFCIHVSIEVCIHVSIEVFRWLIYVGVFFVLFIYSICVSYPLFVCMSGCLFASLYQEFYNNNSSIIAISYITLETTTNCENNEHKKN